jgi:hypothetical protein
MFRRGEADFGSGMAHQHRAEPTMLRHIHDLLL